MSGLNTMHYQVLKKLTIFNRLEVKSLTKLAFLQAACLGLYNSAVQPIILLTIVTYIFTGNNMTADKVFFAVTCFYTLLNTLLFAIPTGASEIGSFLVACKRLQVGKTFDHIPHRYYFCSQTI